MAPNFKKEEVTFPFRGQNCPEEERQPLFRLLCEDVDKPHRQPDNKKLSFHMVFIDNNIILPTQQEYEPTAMFRVRTGYGSRQSK
jgi:hypothetical protein